MGREYWTTNSYPNGYGKMVEPVESLLEPDNNDFQEPVTVLDVGIGSGSAFQKFIAELEEKTGLEFETVGVDPQSPIETAYSESNADHLIRGNDTDLPLKDNSVDLTVSNYLLPYQDGEEQLEIFNEIGRVTKEDGGVSLHVEPSYTEEGDTDLPETWIMSYDDFRSLAVGKEKEDYTLIPDHGTNLRYSDNRGSLPEGFYDNFRDSINEARGE